MGSEESHRRQIGENYGKNWNYRSGIEFRAPCHRRIVRRWTFYGRRRAERECAARAGHGQRRLFETAEGSGNHQNVKDVLDNYDKTTGMSWNMGEANLTFLKDNYIVKKKKE